MPRKKDGMLIEFHPRPTTDEDGKPLLYVRPAVKRTFSLRYIDDFCHKYRGMTRGQLTLALETLLGVAAIIMEDGSRIETPLGTFGPKLKLDGDYTDPDKIKSHNVSFAGIEFIPSKRFQKEVKNQIDRGFRKYHDLSKRQTLSADEDRIAILRGIFRRNGYITISAFAYQCGLKYSTARLWLNSQCEGEAPLLKSKRVGRMMLYRLTEDTPQNTEERSGR